MAKSFKDLPVATGSPAFEKRVQELQDRINSQIPPEARLPAAILQNLPDNVIDIPETCGLLTTKEIDITRLDTTALAEREFSCLIFDLTRTDEMFRNCCQIANII